MVVRLIVKHFITLEPIGARVFFDICVSFYHPGAAGARELAHRAPGAIIIGGGCEFVLEFFEKPSGDYLTA